MGMGTVVMPVMATPVAERPASTAASTGTASRTVMIIIAVLWGYFGGVGGSGALGPHGLGGLVPLIVGALLASLLGSGIPVGGVVAVIAVAPTVAPSTTAAAAPPGVSLSKVGSIRAGAAKGEEARGKGGSRVVVDTLTGGPVGIEGPEEVPDIHGLLLGRHFRACELDTSVPEKIVD